MRAVARERETTGTGRAAEFAKDCISREPASEKTKEEEEEKEEKQEDEYKDELLSPLAK